jgi:DNA helicase-2/ATP-dependent DNA helicase PcrA
MVQAIASDIENLKAQGAKTIAVVCKTSLDAQKLLREIKAIGAKSVDILEEQRPPSESVVFAPIYLLRGLEYDAVVIANAGSDQYPEDRMHARLLYLGVSRAAHILKIHFTGNLTPNLR